MNKTEALQTQLYKILTAIAPNVYYATDFDKDFPYLVYDLSEIAYDSGKTQMQLEINVLDYGKDTTDAEDIADSIQRTLNNYFYIGADITFTAYKSSRQTVKEDDKQIIRRRLLFDINLFEKKGDNE